MNKLTNYQEEERPFDFHNFINKFFRRRHLFLYIAIPIFLFSIITRLAKPYTPIYRASFDIGVSMPVEGFFGEGTGRTPTLQIGTATQRVISSLLSVNLAEKVCDRINLCAYIKNGQSDIRVDVKHDKELKEPIGPLKLKISNGRFSVFKNGEKLGERKFSRFWVSKDSGEVENGIFNESEYVDLGDFKLRITPLKTILHSKTYELTIYPRSNMALALRNSLSIKALEADKVEQIGPSGIPYSGEGASKRLVTATSIFPAMKLIGILRIGVHWGNPDDALKIAEVLSDVIIEEDRSEKSLQFNQSRVFIDSQLTFYHRKLNALEDEIKGFKERKKITDLQASTQALITQISNIESRKSQLQIEQKILSDLDDYLALSKEGVATDFNFAATLVSDPVLQDFYSQLLQTEAELKVRLKEYSSGHPKVHEITAKLAGLKEQMKEEVKKRRSTIDREIASVVRQISMLQAKLENVPADEIKLARFGRDRETAEKLYTFFAEKLEETRVREAGVTSDLRIINPPMLSSSPINSRGRLKSLIISLILGILSGGFAVFIAEYLDNTVKDPDTVAAKLGLPIFASIPIIESKEGKRERDRLVERLGITNIIDNLKGESNKAIFDGPLRVLNGDVSSPEFEAFRKLLLNLDSFRSRRKYPFKKDYRVIYVTSPGPEEGKTFIALNLGVALGTTGKLVLILDTDFRKRKGHLTDAIKSKKELGLFNVLRGEVKLMDVIVEFKPKSSRQTIIRSMYSMENNNYYDAKTSVSNTLIDFMPIGEIPSNPFPFLESEKMVEIIEVLKDTYDYVIIDGVPVLLFADAAYLANLADGVILAVRYGKTGFKGLENAKDVLLNSKLHNIGIVMNGVPKTRGSYYYDYYFKPYSKYYKKGK